MAKHHIIYVPGIRDDLYHAQGILIKYWIVYGVHGHIHPMPWRGSKPYEAKARELTAQIDRYAETGAAVSLMGASAGASAIINAYVERKDKVNGLAYVCGKINRPETVSDQTYADNRAFKESLHLLQNNLKNLTDEDKGKFLSLYSMGDRTVPHNDTLIPGVCEIILPPLSHGGAILYATGPGANTAISFLKRRANPSL